MEKTKRKTKSTTRLRGCLLNVEDGDEEEVQVVNFPSKSLSEEPTFGTPF